MELNFNKVQKHYLRLTLLNEKEPILIGTPTKKLLDKLVNMNSLVDTEDANELNPEQIGDIYNICAEVMSINKTNRKISKAELEEMFDIEDLLLFFNTYMEFLDSIVALKN